MNFGGPQSTQSQPELSSVGGNTPPQLAAIQKLKRRSQQPREAVATQQRMMAYLDLS